MALSRFKFHIAIAVLVFPFMEIAHCKVDKTLEDDVSDEEVVDAVIAKIGSMFGKDFGFFKRLAYVDTATPVAANFTGGIWNVSEAMFEQTQVKNDLNALYGKIYKSFGIKWTEEVEWIDLRKPLYSALALHLYLYMKDSSTLQQGFPQTLATQARYRSIHLISGNRNVQSKSEQDFISLVSDFERSGKRCNAKMDFVVVLDGSGSVGNDNFTKSLEFVARLFAMNSLATVRMGFIVYSQSVETYLTLDSQKTAEEIDTIVHSASYPSFMTNTNEGIKGGISLFRNSEPRPGVPKVMALVTNGVSDEGGLGGNGGVPDIAEARSQGITTYAIGIGSYAKQSELLEIAQNHPGRVFSLNDYNTLLEFSRYLHTQTCAESQTPSIDQNTTEDVLNQDDHRLYRFQWGHNQPLPSFRITLEMTEGHVEAYYGSNRGINRAWNDGQLINGTTTVEHPNLYKKVDNKVSRRMKISQERGFDGDMTYGTSAEEIYNEFYDTDPVGGLSRSAQFLFVYVIGTQLVNKYAIRVEEVVIIPTTATTTTSATKPTTRPTSSTRMITKTPTASVDSNRNRTSTTAVPQSFWDKAQRLVKPSAASAAFQNWNVCTILAINLALIFISL